MHPPTDPAEAISAYRTIRPGCRIESCTSSKSLITGNVRNEESRNEIKKSPGAPSPVANATSLSFAELNHFGTRIHPVLAGFARPPASAPLHHFHYSPRQPRKLPLLHREGRREINHVAERLDPHALLHKSRSQTGRIENVRHLHNPDRALYPHVPDARQSAARLQIFTQLLFDRRDLLEPRLALEQIQRSIRRGATERVCHEGRPVHQRRAGIIREKRAENLFGSRGRGQRQRA